jgi:hypothetical protein
MVDYMSLEEQVDKDFERARRRAFVGRVVARLRRDPRGSGMVAFDEVRRSARADNRFYRGKRIVEVSKIVGSVGRHREFDGRFMPTKASAYKWKRVDRAFRRGVDLPPVSLYRIGDSYFVHDGNHRVSVARYHGVEWMDAEVTEFRPWLVDDIDASSRVSSPRAGPSPGSSTAPSAAPTT